MYAIELVWVKGFATESGTSGFENANRSFNTCTNGS